MELGFVKSSARSVAGFINRNSTSILTGIGVGGVFATAITAARGHALALDLIEEEYFKREKDGVVEGYGPWDDPLTIRELFMLTWKCYLPAVVTGTVTITSIIGANSIGLKRNAAMAGLYSITEAAFTEYREKVQQSIGKGKEERIREDISQDRLNDHPVKDNEVILTAAGDVLCYETLTDRYFRSSAEKIQAAINRFNHRLIAQQDMTLNEFFYELGLGNCGLGDRLGWSAEDAVLQEAIFFPKIATNGEPCLALDYRIGPKRL